MNVLLDGGSGTDRERDKANNAEDGMRIWKAILRGVVAELAVAATWGEAQTALQSELDHGIRVIAEPKPEFPHSLRRRGVASGLAIVAINVDRNDMLVDWLVVYASHRGFEKAIDDVVGQWGFGAARHGEETVDAVQHFPVYFDVERRAMVRNYGSMDDVLSRILEYEMESRAMPKARARSPRLALARELDDFPQCIERPMLKFPENAFQRSLGSEATFEFYIDTEGRVRLPRLFSLEGEVHPAVLRVAQASLERWRFKPLKSQGKPVIFLAKQTFRFSYL